MLPIISLIESGLSSFELFYNVILDRNNAVMAEDFNNNYKAVHILVKEWPVGTIEPNKRMFSVVAVVAPDNSYSLNGIVLCNHQDDINLFEVRTYNPNSSSTTTQTGPPFEAPTSLKGIIGYFIPLPSVSDPIIYDIDFQAKTAKFKASLDVTIGFISFTIGQVDCDITLNWQFN
jgi:hypothetical protein